MAFLKTSIKAKAVAVLAVAALAVGALAGCAEQNGTATQQESADRQYLSQVNQVMDDLQVALGNFTDAVSRDDVVGMQTQAENALSTLNDLDSIEAPENLADVHQSYQEGSDKLRKALNDYVALYTEISSASSDHPFDWSTYQARLADIQASYDAGIDALRAGDQAAADEEGGTQQQDGQQGGQVDDQQQGSSDTQQ